MPKATKDTEKEKLDSKKSRAKKATSTTKTTAVKSKKKTSSKTSTSNKEVKAKSTKKTSTANKTKKENKTTSTKKVETKKTTTKSSSSKKASTAKKTTTKRTSSKAKKIESNVVAEYYDLPYRYNETVVKILYQTPTILFVYWDISDYDRENFVKNYGNNFFNNTKPILKIYNLTKNYNFEVEINDFANSWYINVNDADCEYKVELLRKAIKYEENINTDYIHISSSNNIQFPNDRILLDQLPDKLIFKNVKTNVKTSKDISTMRLIGINKIYKVHNFYKNFYKDEILEEIDSKKLINPSSSSWN